MSLYPWRHYLDSKSHNAIRNDMRFSEDAGVMIWVLGCWMFSVLSLSLVTDSLPGLPDEKVKGAFADKNYKRHSESIAQVWEPELPSKTRYFLKHPLASFVLLLKIRNGRVAYVLFKINSNHEVIDSHFRLLYQNFVIAPGMTYDYFVSVSVKLGCLAVFAS